MGATNKLSATRVAALKTPGRYGDGGGLWLQVTPAGTKSWLLRFERDGRERQMGLGPIELVSLAEAREKALTARKLLLEGIDPIDARRAGRQTARLDSARAITFTDCAERYIAAHEAAWRNEMHRAQWPTTLASYVYPIFGTLPVAAVDTGLVLKALEPIWTAKPETAARVRGRIELVLDWATARGYRQGDNPARWRGHLDKLLPARSKVSRVEHHPALSYTEMPEFLSALRAREGISARALEFCILTATRAGETAGARWAEIDLDARMWAVPGDRTKSGREHRVPLSDAAVEILNALPRERDFVFIGMPGKPLINMSLLQVLRRMGRRDLTTHGFRSTFRDWAAEQTAYPNEVLEMALGHAIKSKAEAAYRRGDLLEKRRRLMADWARFCGSERAPGENVVAIRAGAK